MFILCRAAKNEPRKRAKGSAFGIRLCARKRRGAARPLCSCLRGMIKIQRLCLPLKAQRQTDRTRIFAFRFCLKFLRTRVRRKHQKFLLFCLRASFVLVLGLPSANARFEFAYLREKMSKARATRPFRAHKRIPKAESLADFLSPFLCSATKKWHKRSASAHEVLCERP